MTDFFDVKHSKELLIFLFERGPVNQEEIMRNVVKSNSTLYRLLDLGSMTGLLTYTYHTKEIKNKKIKEKIVTLTDKGKEEAIKFKQAKDIENGIIVLSKSDYEIRNDPANEAGVHQMTLILDGQQRLTSILIGLKGTYEKKQKYKRWSDSAAWTKQKLYIDLLKDPNPDPNEEPNLEEPDNSEIYYGLKFFDHDKPPSNSSGERWFKLGKILDFDNEDNFYKFREEEKDALPDGITKKQVSIFERNLERLYRAVWKDDVISYYTETDQNYDRVLDIFVRANEGGTKLSKSDLLLSMITSSWDGMNARDEIYDFVDRLNIELSRRNNFDKDFVMKSCLVLSDLPVAYKVQNFTQKNLNLIKKNWNSIKRAVEAGVNASNYYGVDGDNLTSTNALIPVCYYLFKHPEVKLTGESSFDVKNSRNVRNWLIASLLNGVFGGSSDSMLSSIRNVLQSHTENADFPISAIISIENRKCQKCLFPIILV